MTPSVSTKEIILTAGTYVFLMYKRQLMGGAVVTKPGIYTVDETHITETGQPFYVKRYHTPHTYMDTTYDRWAVWAADVTSP